MPDISSFINKFTIVKQIPVFNKLNWLELHQIVSKCSIFEYKKGDIICQQGSPPDAFYCLVAGRLLAYTSSENQKKENVEFILRGMHFGIISLLTGEKHSLTFEAINDSVVLKIAKEDFHNILKSIPRLGVEFSHSLSRRIRTQSVGGKSIFESSIISIYSAMKGSGSSTFAFNLALSLNKETQRKVVLLNIVSPSEKSEGGSSPVNEASPLWKKKAVELKEIVGDHDKILQNVSKGELDVDLLRVVFDPQDESMVSQIGRFVSSLANDYHYVVVDLPNSMDDVVMKTLTQSDMVYLVTLDKEKNLKLTRHVIERLKELLKDNFSIERLQVLVCALQPQCYLSYEQMNRALHYDVATILPNISRSDLNIAVVSKDITAITPHERSAYYKSVTHIARRLGGVLVGLVLGGGAALGLAHVGVIRVLERENIPVDIVVGSSIGALIGGLWTVGRNAKQLEEVAREFEKKKSILKLLDPIFPKAGLIGGRLIRRWLNNHLENKTFYSTKIPFKVVAYDLVRRKEIVIGEGSLADAIRQSVAIPGVINPILKGDQVIIDGGVLNPLPTNVLTSLGIKKIIAVNVLQSPEHVSTGFDESLADLEEQLNIPFWHSPIQYCGIRMKCVLNKLFYPNIADIIVCSLQATEYVLAEQSGSQADILIHPDLTGINWFELHRFDELIKRGEEAAERQLPRIKDLIKQ